MRIVHHRERPVRHSVGFIFAERHIGRSLQCPCVKLPYKPQCIIKMVSNPFSESDTVFVV